MNKMIFANLVHRPFRTIISIVAVAVEVTLILLIVGLSVGMLTDTKNRQVGIGADIMVQPPGSSLLMGVSGAPVSIKVADRLRTLDGDLVVDGDGDLVVEHGQRRESLVLWDEEAVSGGSACPRQEDGQDGQASSHGFFLS
jgi:hypothetical protein